MRPHESPELNLVLPGQWRRLPRRVRAFDTAYAAFLNYGFEPKAPRFERPQKVC